MGSTVVLSVLALALLGSIVSNDIKNMAGEFSYYCAAGKSHWFTASVGLHVLNNGDPPLPKSKISKCCTEIKEHIFLLSLSYYLNQQNQCLFIFWNKIEPKCCDLNRDPAFLNISFLQHYSFPKPLKQTCDIKPRGCKEPNTFWSPSYYGQSLRLLITSDCAVPMVG